MSRGPRVGGAGAAGGGGEGRRAVGGRVHPAVHGGSGEPCRVCEDAARCGGQPDSCYRGEDMSFVSFEATKNSTMSGEAPYGLRI